MITLKCPVCSASLSHRDSSFICGQGHSYDISKYDYVNLLMSNKSSEKRHGDDKMMVRCRRDFLDKGYYAPLKDALCQMLQSLPLSRAHIMDVGCGEGYYSSAARKALEEKGIDCCCLGLDISKDALIYAHRRDDKLKLVVGSINALPVCDGECDVLLSIFAPTDDGEFARVLGKGAYYIKAIPLEKHLLGLKEAIYDRPYENEVSPYLPEGFELVKTRDIEYLLRLDNGEDIQSLFKMTPYYYKTGKADQEKLARLTKLQTTVQFRLMLFRRK